MPQVKDTIIFDLSDVIISGIVGIERILSMHLGFPEAEVLSAFNCQELQDLCCGSISEESYLDKLITSNEWKITVKDLKARVRENFNAKIDGMEHLLVALSEEYHLVLLSDNAKEWVSYISSIHSVLDLFSTRIFSYDIRCTKRQVSTFKTALRIINRRAEQCLFIDDNIENVRRAQSIGISSIQFKSTHQLVNDLLSVLSKERSIKMAISALKKI